MKKYISIIVCLIIFSFGGAGQARAEVVKDPFIHFVAYYQSFPDLKLSPDDKIFYFTADFGQDKKYLFLSLMSLMNGKLGNGWRVYAYTKSGYEPLSGGAEFPRNPLALTTLNGVDGLALVAYLPSNADHGTLHTIQIIADKVVERDLKVIEPQGKDKGLYSELFSNAATKIEVSERPLIETVQAKIAKEESAKQVEKWRPWIFYSVLGIILLGLIVFGLIKLRRR